MKRCLHHVRGVIEREVVGRMEGIVRRHDLQLAYPVIFSKRGEVLHNHGHGLELEEGEDGDAVDPWAAAQARMGDVLRPTFGASPFAAVEGDQFAPGPLASGVTIERLIVPHEPEPRVDGHGAIYFFPGGQTEHAVVWISDGSDQIYALELHPLTGRTRVHNYAYEPDVMLDDGRGESRSEVED